MSNNLPSTIAEASRRIKGRDLSPLELADGLLKRIELIDPVINSFITVTAEQALAQAGTAESEIGKGRYRGPLHGIPFGAKDNYETVGIRTTGHSIFTGGSSSGSAAAVSAGLILFALGGDWSGTEPQLSGSRHYAHGFFS